MTTNNAKKLSSIKLLFALVVTIALVSVSTTYVSAEPVPETSGEKVTTGTDKEVLDLSEETVDLYEKYKPEKISNTKAIDYNRIVLNDSRIQELIGAKSFEITGYTHEGNLKTNPGVWDVLVHMNVDDRIVVAKISAETNEVDFVSDKPQRKLLPHGFAVDYYDGTKTLNLNSNEERSNGDFFYS